MRFVSSTRAFACGLFIVASAPAAASGFDWGDACSDGTGNFSQFIPRNANVVIGDIAEGKADVAINLNSDRDVDVRVTDATNGHQVIAWPSGDLNGASQACTTYAGAEFCWSGYNGDGVNYGHEWITINGTTDRVFTMSAYGYAAGDALVTYSWSAPEGCVDAGDGEFAQWVEEDTTLLVGTIPQGKSNIDIELMARNGRDVDVQVYDGNTAVVAWPNGLMNGPSQQTIDYHGMRITYSGYNGRNNDWGDEFIRITGTLDRDLTMYVFGYQSGYADVTYAWGHGQLGDGCGGRTVIPAHGCLDDLVCVGAGLAVDIPGTCQLDPAAVPLSLQELATGAATYDDQLVEVTAQVEIGAAMCTKMACSPANPCCNSCAAPLNFVWDQTTIALDGLGCAGNECTYADNCPYEAGAFVTATATVNHTVSGASAWTSLDVSEHTEAYPETCFTGGCSGEVCSPDQGVITTCNVQPWHQCLQFAECGNHGADASCAWEPNVEYLDCLDSF